MAKLMLKFMLLITVFLCGMMVGVRQFGSDAGPVKSNSAVPIEVANDNLPGGEIVDTIGEEDEQTSNHYSQLGDMLSNTITGMFRGVVTAGSTMLEHLMPEPSTRS